MKKSIVTLLCLATLAACKKNETTVVDHSTDSTAMVAANDSTTMVKDSVDAGKLSSLNDQDKKFADDAARGGMMEVMMGELAATNASNSRVKELGNMMVQDHGKANDELKNWASAIGYPLPTKLDAEKQKKYDDLMTKKGVDFDRAYSSLMVKDHKEDIAAFKKEAADGAEDGLKLFAGKTVPTLEHHLVQSEEVAKAVK
ncbi:DUF4142 domain-containing protein [Chryseobacterium sp.]|uniref:DUF4142 domain-containing protein n=1 Tax=Chryseobacterium sp. TaxID=1871047 RepID=UPI0011CAE742|nr:DUF4142 domain-containing protein [Chryseobacterium sp.]TXF74930.1 DUF4142 domain-containing protein [Chryseobacterium sp.]